jgi:hypothetical protein
MCKIFFSIIMLLIPQLLSSATDSIIPTNTIVKIFDREKVPVTADPPCFNEIARVNGFPVIQKWMYQNDMQKANWLGLKWDGKNLLEPINIIFIDTISRTVSESNHKLIENLKRAGYSKKPHHSSGYIGYIGGTFYPQIPREKYYAFSNENAEIDNNHGRIFGPCRFNSKYFYTAAFSREVINPFTKIMHRYGSFNRARDELSQSLDKNSAFRIVGFVNLNNAIIDNKENTTADHDGVAVVLSLADFH